MNRDPLEFFNSLPDFPGKTPPKNRKIVSKDPLAEDRLNGAKSKIMKINGVDRQFFTVGELAKAVNRKPVTIRSWELNGWLPKAKYRTPAPRGTQIPGKVAKGRRLYSLEQVEFLLTALLRFEIDNPAKANWDGFRQHIKNQWPND
ncbi:hypothetical protein UFOVP629_33 [uncultured Caudovirales phage]|uniref:HTH merR-type domain-containing protein n=1 Tax=uncultured Caudovirales phage TaxID=2100421 RepID=A0A6J5N8G9_9CAUD|nr:hypothetical protein UFOVP629_33 [uncultured Caudovirales phage]